VEEEFLCLRLSQALQAQKVSPFLLGSLG